MQELLRVLAWRHREIGRMWEATRSRCRIRTIEFGLMDTNSLKVTLRRLLRVRDEILREQETVPVELDTKIEEVTERIASERETVVIHDSQTQRRIPTQLNGR